MAGGKIGPRKHFVHTNAAKWKDRREWARRSTNWSSRMMNHLLLLLLLVVILRRKVKYHFDLQ